MISRLRFRNGKQKELLLLLKKKLNLSQRQLAKKLSVSRRCLRNWINEDRLLSSNVFDIAVQNCPVLKRFEKEVEKVHEPNWGSKKGGRKRYRQLLENEEFTSHHQKMMAKKQQKSKMKKIELPKTSNFFKSLKKENLPSLPPLASMIMTDGYLKRNGDIGFTSKDFKLTNIFIDFIRNNSKKPANISKKKNGIYESSVFDPLLATKLLLLSPNYTTSPRNENKEEYLKKPQPTLSFLPKQNRKTRALCIRLGMSCDGYVTIRKNKQDSTYGYIGLSCAHPLLTKEWKNSLSEFDINMSIVTKKGYWSEISGLRTGSKEALSAFLDIGGFIEGNKITGKSPKFAGVEKNVLLKLCLGELKEIY